MKKLVFALTTITAIAWMLVACSGSNNSNNGNCGVTSPYNTGVYGQPGYTNPAYGGNPAYGNPALNPAYNNSLYNNGGCVGANGLPPYYNPAGNYPMNGACSGNLNPVYYQYSGASYCYPNYMLPQIMPYATPNYYQSSFWWYVQL